MAIGRGVGRTMGLCYGMDDWTPSDFDLQSQEARSVCVDVGISRATLRHYDDVPLAAGTSQADCFRHACGDRSIVAFSFALSR